MRAAWFAVGALGVLWSTPALARTVVVLPFEPVGTTQQQADLLGGYFRDAAQKLPGLTVMGDAMTRELVDEAVKGGWKMDLTPSALVKLTPLLRADAYVTGHVSPDAVGAKAVIRLIEATRGDEEKRIERSVLLGGTDPADGMRAAAVELLQPSLFRGALEVNCPMAGVTVVLGTESLGECRTSVVVRDAAPGAHTVRLRKDGMAEAQRRVEVVFDRTTVTRVEETANGLQLSVDAETRAGGADLTLAGSGQPAAGTTAPAAQKDPPAAKQPMSPLLYAGGAMAVAGAPLAVLGVFVTVGSAITTAAWPRTDGGTIRNFPWETSSTLVSARVFGVLAFIPVGLLMALLGIGLLGGGVAVAIAGLFMGGTGE